MLNWLTKVVGDGSEREIKRIQPIVREINDLAPKMESSSDDELRSLTEELRDRLGNGEAPDDVLPEAYAAVREASRRTIGLRHYDAQLMGGIVLNRRKIGELKTGEGKT